MGQHTASKQPGRGFTLVELMIAVVLIAVLSSVAYPSFMDAVRKSRRSEAFAALNSIQQAQERWRANNPTYSQQLTNGAGDTPPGLGLSATTSGGYYTLAIEDGSAGATTYTATATAASGKSQTADGNCARLRLRVSSGNTFYGSATAGGAFDESAVNACWRR